MPLGMAPANHEPRNSKSNGGLPRKHRRRHLILVPSTKESHCVRERASTFITDTMASLMRPTLLRQTALASRSLAAAPAFARPAVRSEIFKAATFHTSTRRTAILPPGPRKPMLLLS